MNRSGQLMKCFFTGIVPDIPEASVEKRREEWKTLTLKRKRALIAKIDERAKARRASMAENATRNNYIFAGLAFITAASTNVTLATSTQSLARSVLQLGTPVILLAVSIFIGGDCRQSKGAWKEKSGIRGDEMLEKELRAQEYDTKNPDMALLHEYETVAFRLHKRDVILIVERRAQRVATYLAIVGLLILIIGFWFR